MKRATAGYTLIEIVTVLGIIFIVAGVLGWYTLSWYATSQVIQATAQISGDLEKARSNAVFKSRKTTFTLGADGRSYTIKYNDNGKEHIDTYDLPEGVTVVPKSSRDSSITYSSPFGTVSTNARTLIFKNKLAKDHNLYIVGVTGKVIIP